MKFKVLDKRGVSIPEDKKHFAKGETGDADPSIVDALVRTKSVEVVEKKSDTKTT